MDVYVHASIPPFLSLLLAPSLPLPPYRSFHLSILHLSSSIPLNRNVTSPLF